MDQQVLTRDIAQAVVRDTQFWIAVVGLAGALIGALITVFGSVLLHWLQSRKTDALDKARKRLLKEMLDARDWRRLSTLSRVIGAETDTTKRLLIELGVRGSEASRQDGEEVWGLLSKHPIAGINEAA